MGRISRSPALPRLMMYDDRPREPLCAATTFRKASRGVGPRGGRPADPHYFLRRRRPSRLPLGGPIELPLPYGPTRTASLRRRARAGPAELAETSKLIQIIAPLVAIIVVRARAA